MLSIIDKLIISFLYINVLTSQQTILNFPITKTIILLSIYIYAIYFLGRHQSSISKRFCIYIISTIIFITILTLISICNNNDFSNIQQFIYPFFILVTIPLFGSLFEAYGIERYLRHLLFAVVLLATATSVIYFITAENRGIAFLINDHSNNFQITYPDFGPRVLSKTGAFFPSGLLLALFFLLRERKMRYGLYFILISFALYHNHTFTIIVAGLVTLYLFVVMFDKSHVRKIFSAVIGICVVVMVGALYLNDTYAHKKQSLDIKVEQTYKAWEIFSEGPIVGQGLGFVFQNMDDRLTDTLVLEVSYMTILASTGFFGVIFYLFIYLYYPIIGFLHNHLDRGYTKLLILCFLSILIAGSGNPYIFSGGMGLFFIVLLGAVVERSSIKNAIYVDGQAA